MSLIRSGRACEGAPSKKRPREAASAAQRQQRCALGGEEGWRLPHGATRFAIFIRCPLDRTPSSSSTCRAAGRGEVGLGGHELQRSGARGGAAREARNGEGSRHGRWRTSGRHRQCPGSLSDTLYFAGSLWQCPGRVRQSLPERVSDTFSGQLSLWLSAAPPRARCGPATPSHHTASLRPSPSGPRSPEITRDRPEITPTSASLRPSPPPRSSPGTAAAPPPIRRHLGVISASTRVLISAPSPAPSRLTLHYISSSSRDPLGALSATVRTVDCGAASRSNTAHAWPPLGVISRLRLSA